MFGKLSSPGCGLRDEPTGTTSSSPRGEGLVGVILSSLVSPSWGLCFLCLLTVPSGQQLGAARRAPPAQTPRFQVSLQAPEDLSWVVGPQRSCCS